MDLETMLKRLAVLTESVLTGWERSEFRNERDESDEWDEETLEGGIWLVLEHDDRDHRSGAVWQCGYAYRPDEATEWAIVAEGATPTEAAAALLEKVANSEP